ncbi:diaminopimelate epimerase [Clostridiales bacterium PH28_bin88]|nr:diaminopimelate epimerase [Clostridiales bacterium PH28_bin88]
MRFSKMHGLGNDFVLINAMEARDLGDLNELAKRMCDRHFGIGADGLILVLPSGKADVRMRIFNSDGSEPEMCGNGIRCFAKYVYEQGIVQKEEIRVETLAGIMVPKLIMESDQITGVRVDMGEPILERRLVPMGGEGPSPVVDEPLAVGNQTFNVTAVSMGNPHCVIFVPEVEAIPLETLGPRLETHPSFPRKTNVEFVQALGPGEVKMRVWERGAGPTLACGTGACAVGVAGVLNGKTNRRVSVHLTAGDMDIHWDEKDNHVYMTGPAVEVFCGEFLLY